MASTAGASRQTSGELARTRLKKAGGSLIVTMPAAARNLLQLQEGQELSVSVEGARVVMQPVAPSPAPTTRRPKYSLEELVAQTRPTTLSEEEQTWHDAPAAGRETW